jgi:hypothetical protein
MAPADDAAMVPGRSFTLMFPHKIEYNIILMVIIGQHGAK